MKKLLLLFVFLATTGIVYGANTLYEYYGYLPPLSERAVTYKDVSQETYSGTAEQNTALLNHLQSQKFGSGGVTVKPGTVGVPLIGGTSGSVLFVNSALNLAQNNANFFWDNTNSRLGLGTVAPLSKLDVNGSAAIGTFAGSVAAPSNGLIVSGKVGFGTSTPYDNFDLAKAGGANLNVVDLSAGANIKYARIRSQSGFLFLENPNDTYTALRSDIAIDLANQRLGIVNLAPRVALDVLSGTANTSGDIPGLILVTDADVLNTTGASNFTIQTNTAQGADVGGTFGFGGRYITANTDGTLFASITGAKNTSVTGDLGGYLGFTTRNDAGTLSEKMRITSTSTGITGIVGIGTTSPTGVLGVEMGAQPYAFWVGDTASTTDAAFVVTGGNRVGIATSSPWRTFSVIGTATINGLTVAAGTPNSVCIVALGKEITENAALTCTVSARDQKTKIEPLPVSGIDTVMSLIPEQFAYKDYPDRIRWGFIADEVQATNHALGDGYNSAGHPADEARSIDENALISVSVKAIQELVQKNKELEARIEKLEQK